MTAISSEVKKKITRKLKIPWKQDTAKILLCLAAGFVSGRSIWRDIPMAATAVVLACCCDDMLCRYVLLAGSVVSCGLLYFSESMYIAYFLAGIIFIAVDNFTAKRQYALAASCGVIAVVKLLLVYHSMPLDYKLLALLEAAAVYTRAATAKAGISAITTAHSRSFTDMGCGLVALLAITLAFTGADSRFLYASLAVAFGAGWFYISNGLLTAGTTALVAGLLVSFDKTGFAYLFISLVAVWLAGGFFAERKSLAIYPAVILSAVGANIMFISSLGSFALAGSAVGGLIVYILMPHLTFLNFRPAGNVFTRGRDWRLLMLNLKKLENSLSFLASSVIDISRLNDRNNHIQPLEDMVAEDVCRKCDKNTYCWQEKYSFTQQQFSEYGRKMNWAGENRFSSGFCAQCINVGGVVSSFEENSRLLLSKKYIAQSQKTNQKLLQNAFLSISSAVGDLIYQNQRSYLINTAITMETDRFLTELDVQHSYCLCSQNPDQACFATVESVDDKSLYKIQNKLEYLYGTKFSSPQIEQQGTELVYIFRARPVFDYDVAVETSRYKTVNGDNREIFTWNGRLYALLSDGMGTGRLAAAESRTVIAMAKSLITSGVSMKNVIDIINLALNLKGSGENSASVDILQIDLSDGSTTITKAGAGVSILLDSRGVTRYYRDSLPLGILKDVKPVECNFRMSAGSTVILMSDGAGVVSGSIKNMYADPCSRIAQTIIAENKTRDDKTVIAIRLKINI